MSHRNCVNRMWFTLRHFLCYVMPVAEYKWYAETKFLMRKMGRGSRRDLDELINGTLRLHPLSTNFIPPLLFYFCLDNSPFPLFCATRIPVQYM